MSKTPEDNKNLKAESVKNNLHEGHRNRLKNRFLQDGLSSMESHNILELLLFYSVPRKDTNELAHSLIDRFGSLAAVFDANEEELLSVNGITKSSAVLIKMIPQLAGVYMRDKYENKSVFTDNDSIGRYLVGYFVGKTEECVVLMLLNGKKLLHICEISSGTPSMSEVNIRKIAELAFEKKATSFVLAHNHLSGDCNPSKEDIRLTGTLLHTFDTMNVSLREHFVIYGEEYCGILERMHNNR